MTPNVCAKTIIYTFDPVGNRETMTDPDAGVTTYSDDSRNMLSWLVNPFSERTTWLYDALGRVTTMTHANASVAEHDYDAGGRPLGSERFVGRLEQALARRLRPLQVGRPRKTSAEEKK